MRYSAERGQPRCTQHLYLWQTFSPPLAYELVSSTQFPSKKKCTESQERLETQRRSTELISSSPLENTNLRLKNHSLLPTSRHLKTRLLTNKHLHCRIAVIHNICSNRQYHGSQSNSTPLPAPTSFPESSLSKGTKAGIAIGDLLFVAIFSLVAFLFCFQRK
jgi:hypothetical protein